MAQERDDSNTHRRDKIARSFDSGFILRTPQWMKPTTEAAWCHMDDVSPSRERSQVITVVSFLFRGRTASSSSSKLVVDSPSVP